MILQNLSIKRKLTLITMLTSSAALVLSALSFLIYDLVSFRHLLIQDLMTQAEIIGYNSAGAMESRCRMARGRIWRKQLRSLESQCPVRM